MALRARTFPALAGSLGAQTALLYRLFQQLYRETRNAIRALEVEAIVHDNEPVYYENEQVTAEG